MWEQESVGNNHSFQLFNYYYHCLWIKNCRAIKSLNLEEKIHKFSQKKEKKNIVKKGNKKSICLVKK